MDDFRILRLSQNVAPNLEVSGHKRISVAIPFKTGRQHEQRRCRSKRYSIRRIIGRAERTQGGIETLDAFAGRKVQLLSLAGACQSVKIGCQPSMILFEQLKDKF